MKLITLWRIAFFCGVLFTFWFFFFNVSQLSIDTDLKDLSPKVSNKPQISNAIETLSADAKKRIVLLVAADDESKVNAVVELIKERVFSSADLGLHSEDLLESQIIKLFYPYRFNVLTSKQKKLLVNKTIGELTSLEQRKLYRLGEGLRLLPFDKDPLAWFSEYILSSLETFQLSEPAVSGQGFYFSLFPLVIHDSVDTMDKQELLLAQLESIEQSVLVTHGVEIKHSGLFFFTIDAAKKSKQDILKIAIGSMIGVLFLMLVVFRSLIPLLISFVSIFFGVGFATAIIYSIYGKIHVLTIVFGASLIGIVIDYSLHYFFHQFSLQKSQSQPHVVDNKKSKSRLVRAMLLSVITSLIGFSALGFSELESLKKVAVFSCSGVIMAWLTVMALGGTVSPGRFKGDKGPLALVLHIFQVMFSSRPKVMLGIGAVLCLSCFVYALFFGVKAGDDPRLFFKASSDLITQERYIRQYSKSFEENRYFIVSGKSASGVYEKLSSFHERVESGSDDRIFSLLSIVPSPEDQNKNYKLQKKLYGKKAVVESLLETLGVSGETAEQALRDYNKAKDLLISPEIIQESLPQLPPLWAEVGNDIHAYIFVGKGSDLERLRALANGFPSIEYVDAIALTKDALQQQRHSASQLLIAAYVLVALLMFLYYRKASAVLLLGIPIAATIFTVCLLSLIGQAITIFHVMALFLVLGLGMDYVIFASEMREHNSITMQAIILSAITTLMSFGLLSFSSMPVVQAFGTTLLIGNTVNLVATIALFKSTDNKLTETS